jgi:hypothetical protein
VPDSFKGSRVRKLGRKGQCSRKEYELSEGTKMSLKTRIGKIEKKLPNKDKEPTIFMICYDGVPKPTKEEKEIAIKKALEIDPDSMRILITFLPYGGEKMIIPRPGEGVVWDNKLGLGIRGKSVYKFVGERPKGKPYD